MSDLGTDPTRHEMVIVTGLSGAGKSAALHAFEDIGYQAIDNLPLTMLPDLLQTAAQKGVPPLLAVGIDSRTLHFSPDLFGETISAIRARGDINLHVLFMDASDDVLMKRFSETRRLHPLGKGLVLRHAIRKERDLMVETRQHVDGLIDTSTRTAAETRRVVLSRFAADRTPKLIVTFMSFGFAYGVPRDADMVLDVRFLRNPHYQPDLKPLTGQTEAVANFVKADAAFGPFLERVEDLLTFLLPKYRDEGKSYLTLAFGCTGGKHRSVAVSETVAGRLALEGVSVNLYHREIAGNDTR